MQNYMEQSPSSLSLLSRKQSLWSFSVITQGLVSHPFCSVTEYSEDTLQVLSVSGSPPFHKSSVRFCCCKCEAAAAVWALQGEPDTGTVTTPSKGSNSAQQLRGGGARGHSQPLSPLTGPPGPVHSARQSPTLGFHSCPNNHISPDCYLKKSHF